MELICINYEDVKTCRFTVNAFPLVKTDLGDTIADYKSIQRIGDRRIDYAENFQEFLGYFKRILERAQSLGLAVPTISIMDETGAEKEVHYIMLVYPNKE